MLHVLFVRLRFSARSQAARYGFERSLFVFIQYNETRLYLNPLCSDCQGEETLNNRLLGFIWRRWCFYFKLVRFGGV